jgi:hypothetical protein
MRILGVLILPFFPIAVLIDTTLVALVARERVTFPHSIREMWAAWKDTFWLGLSD